MFRRAPSLAFYFLLYNNYCLLYYILILISIFADDCVLYRKKFRHNPLHHCTRRLLKYLNGAHLPVNLGCGNCKYISISKQDHFLYTATLYTLIVFDLFLPINISVFMTIHICGGKITFIHWYHSAIALWIT